MSATMIICPHCGASNRDELEPGSGRRCGNCGNTAKPMSDENFALRVELVRAASGDEAAERAIGLREFMFANVDFAGIHG